jgi:hypothetical protein
VFVLPLAQDVVARFLRSVYQYVCFDSEGRQQVNWDVLRVVVDCSDAEIAGISRFSREFGLDVQVRLCWFHVKQAVFKWMTAKGVDKDIRERILACITGMRWAGSESDFHVAWSNTRRYCMMNNLPQFVTYFERYYVARKEKWVRAFDRLQDSWGMATNNILDK